MPNIERLEAEANIASGLAMDAVALRLWSLWPTARNDRDRCHALR